MFLPIPAYLENLQSLYKNPELMDFATTERSRLEEVVKLSFTQLIEIGYSEFTIEDFYEVSSNSFGVCFKILFFTYLQHLYFKGVFGVSSEDF